MHHAKMHQPDQQQQAQEVLLPVQLPPPEILTTSGNSAGNKRNKRKAATAIPKVEKRKKSVRVIPPLPLHDDINEKPKVKKPKTGGFTYQQLLKRAKRRWPKSYDGY